MLNALRSALIIQVSLGEYAWQFRLAGLGPAGFVLSFALPFGLVRYDDWRLSKSAAEMPLCGLDKCLYLVIAKTGEVHDLFVAISIRREQVGHSVFRGQRL